MEEKNNEILDNMSFDDEEAIVVTITDDEGNETEFIQEMVVPVGDKQFAVLVALDDCDCEDEECECHHDHEHGEEEDENVIIARIDYDEDGEPIYVAPTDEEFEAFQETYENLDWEDEE